MEGDLITVLIWIGTKLVPIRSIDLQPHHVVDTINGEAPYTPVYFL